MRQVFADTCYWIALFNEDDGLHTAALDATNSLGECSVVTAEAVLMEFLNFSGRRPALRALAARKVRQILDSPGIEVVPLSHEAFIDALAFYEARPDKRYSLTDCLSMQIMAGRDIQDVLTADRHFGQEGFNVLLQTR